LLAFNWLKQPLQSVDERRA